MFFLLTFHEQLCEICLFFKNFYELQICYFTTRLCGIHYAGLGLVISGTRSLKPCEGDMIIILRLSPFTNVQSMLLDLQIESLKCFVSS